MKLMYFKLDGGGHTEGTLKNNTFIEYKKGDVIETTVDLEKKFGSKFKRILDASDLLKEKIRSIEEEFITTIKEPVMPKDTNTDFAGEYRLSILICSIKGREKKLKGLLDSLQKQKTEQVEILVEIDNRRISTGAKRNLLLKKAKGDYIAFIDDDDEVSVNYIVKILQALKTNPDCCSLEGMLIRPGHKYKFIHSIKYDTWFSKNDVYYRCPNHLNTVKRELALQIGFPKINQGEDMDYSVRLRPLLETEANIEGILYYYIKDKKWIRP